MLLFSPLLSSREDALFLLNPIGGLNLQKSQTLVFALFSSSGQDLEHKVTVNRSELSFPSSF